MRVDVLALDGVFDLGLSAVVDGLQTANELIELSGIAAPRFHVRVVGMRKRCQDGPGPERPGSPRGPAVARLRRGPGARIQDARPAGGRPRQAGRR